jgi:Ca2+-binding EF-hand superfamily protein
MGACFGRMSSKERKDVMLTTFKRTLDEYRVGRLESETLYHVFDGGDETRDGFLNRGEFFDMLGYKNSAFSRRIFDLFDTNTSHELDFGEFVTMAWNYMTPTPFALVKLMFALCDANDSGEITPDEVVKVADELLVDPNFDTSMLSEMNLSLVSLKKKIYVLNFERFGQVAMKYPAILYPALRVQESFRNKVGGLAFWNNLTAKRAGDRTAGTLHSFLQTVRSKALNHGLAEALTVIRDGKVSDEELGSSKEFNNQRMSHSRLFNRSGGFARKLSKLSSAFFGASRNDLDDAPRKRSRNRANKPPAPKKPSLIRGATQRLLEAVKRTKRAADEGPADKGGSGGASKRTVPKDKVGASRRTTSKVSPGT